MTQTEKTFLNMLSRALGASVPDEPAAGDDGELLSLAAAHKLVPLLSTVFPAGEIPKITFLFSAFIAE